MEQAGQGGDSFRQLAVPPALSGRRIDQPAVHRIMTLQAKRSIILAVAIFLLLLALVGVGWFSTHAPARKHAAILQLTRDHTLRTSSGDRTVSIRTNSRRSQEAIAEAAEKWYQELLVKYPRMKPEYRDVPEAENGYLQLLKLAEGAEDFLLPDDLAEMLGGLTAWDSAKFEEWLVETKDYRDRIVEIAELPDRSIKGLDFARLSGCTKFTAEFGKILSGSARLSFDAGDTDSALRYSRAAISLGDHLTNVEVPSVLGQVISAGYTSRIRDNFVENFMPSLWDDPEALATWREALFRKEDTAAAYGRLLSGEWNVFTRTQVLPALLGAHVPATGEMAFDVPDTGAFFEQITAATERLSAGFSSSGPDRLDLSRSEFDFPDSGTDPQTLRMLREITGGYRGIFTGLGIQTTRAAMVSAAVSVKLGETPAIDPVSGQPFLWDPATRTLASPTESENLESIHIP